MPERLPVRQEYTPKETYHEQLTALLELTTQSNIQNIIHEAINAVDSEKFDAIQEVQKQVWCIFDVIPETAEADLQVVAALQNILSARIRKDGIPERIEEHNLDKEKDPAFESARVYILTLILEQLQQLADVELIATDDMQFYSKPWRVRLKGALIAVQDALRVCESHDSRIDDVQLALRILSNVLYRSTEWEEVEDGENLMIKAENIFQELNGLLKENN